MEEDHWRKRREESERERMKVLVAEELERGGEDGLDNLHVES